MTRGLHEPQLRLEGSSCLHLFPCTAMVSNRQGGALTVQVACLQVGKLLRSLNINAEQLPSGGQGPPQSWDAIFRAGET